MISAVGPRDHREMVHGEDEKSPGKGGFILVLDQFPQRRELIEKLFHANLSFQSLCEEYRECLRALRRWRRSTSSEASTRRAEYTALLEELEQEILDYLEPDEINSKQNFPAKE